MLLLEAFIFSRRHSGNLNEINILERYPIRFQLITGRVNNRLLTYKKQKVCSYKKKVKFKTIKINCIQVL